MVIKSFLWIFLAMGLHPPFKTRANEIFDNRMVKNPFSLEKKTCVIESLNIKVWNCMLQNRQCIWPVIFQKTEWVLIVDVKRKTRGPHSKDGLPLKRLAWLIITTFIHYYQLPFVFLMFYLNEMQGQVFKFSEKMQKKLFRKFK